MIKPGVKRIELQEYQEAYLSRAQLTQNEGELIWQRYAKEIAIEFPSPKTQDRWQLIPQGWVGHIPVSPELELILHPKVSLVNLFGMWEYAYRLGSFRFLAGLTDCSSLEEFYERLAHVLARKVIDRTQRGLYRNYITEHDTLPIVRGQLDVSSVIRRPWDLKLTCLYEEHTPDLVDNQILAWTLMTLARTGLCSDQVLPTIQKAYRLLQGMVSLVPQSPTVCVDRQYNRLNDDYASMHALCRFFLEQIGPTHVAGEANMLPFLVDMARLYELFVAEWLRSHLPPNLEVIQKERIYYDDHEGRHFEADIVLYERGTNLPVLIIDTKYKKPLYAAPADVAQAVAYAETKGCKEAVLVYPEVLKEPLDNRLGHIRVRGIQFGLSCDLEVAGNSFLASLLGSVVAATTQ